MTDEEQKEYVKNAKAMEIREISERMDKITEAKERGYNRLSLRLEYSKLQDRLNQLQ